MNTLQLVVELATDYLQKRGVKRARLQADTLLAHVLNLKRIELYMHFERPLDEEELALYRSVLRRAANHEPLDYILGEVEFFGCRLKVGAGALIPRQETEILVEKICNSIDGTEKRALDLCTGSGCIAAALKNRFPQMEVVGVDLSEEALSIARQNHRGVTWLKGDLTAPVACQKFDLIICNPPYVTEAEYPLLEPSVRDFEPKMALVGGEKGTEFYVRLGEELQEVVNPGAKIFFEIGSSQGEAVQKIFSTGPWANLQILQDWAGHDRFFLLNLKENSPIMGATHYV